MNRTLKFLAATSMSLAISITMSCSGDDGSEGKPGLPGASCVATPIENGVSIACGEDEPIEIKNGAKGDPGQGINGTDCKATSVEGGVSIKCGKDDPVVLTNGASGKTPTCESGTWHIGTTDTGVSCVGTPGAAGEAGPPGPQGIQGIQGPEGVGCSLSDEGAYVVITCGTGPAFSIPKPRCGGDIYDAESYVCIGDELTKFIDKRDGNEYKMVKIGEQYWMAENLNYSAEGTIGSCYGVTDADPAVTDAANCITYGRLYDWATAMNIDAECNEKWTSHETEETCGVTLDAKHQGICPDGWHVPTDAEWGALMQTVVPECSATATCAEAGTILKAESGWSGDPGNGTDDFGFSALPGGGRYSGSFRDAGSYGRWWSATEDSATNARNRGMSGSSAYVTRNFSNKSNNWFSLRCVRD